MSRVSTSAERSAICLVAWATVVSAARRVKPSNSGSDSIDSLTEDLPLSADDHCPYPQFELLRQGPYATPYADACAQEYVIPSGSCKGATVFIKPIGVYTSVIDVRAPSFEVEWPCEGRELADVIILGGAALVPAAYFGLGGKPGLYPDSTDLESGSAGCVAFPLAMPNMRSWEKHARDGIDRSMKQCSKVLARRSGTLMHANPDFDNTNMWHSTAHLHALWTASTVLAASGAPLAAPLDVTSGLCACADGGDRIEVKRACGRSKSLAHKAEIALYSSVPEAAAEEMDSTLAHALKQASAEQADVDYFLEYEKRRSDASISHDELQKWSREARPKHRDQGGPASAQAWPSDPSASCLARAADASHAVTDAANQLKDAMIEARILQAKRLVSGPGVDPPTTEEGIAAALAKLPPRARVNAGYAAAQKLVAAGHRASEKITKSQSHASRLHSLSDELGTSAEHGLHISENAVTDLVTAVSDFASSALKTADTVPPGDTQDAGDTVSRAAGALLTGINLVSLVERAKEDLARCMASAQPLYRKATNEASIDVNHDDSSGASSNTVDRLQACARNANATAQIVKAAGADLARGNAGYMFRPLRSTNGLCTCSLATRAVGSLLLPVSNSKSRKSSEDLKADLSHVRPLSHWNNTHCYARHVFVLRHRKRGPLHVNASQAAMAAVADATTRAAMTSRYSSSSKHATITDGAPIFDYRKITNGRWPDARPPEWQQKQLAVNQTTVAPGRLRQRQLGPLQRQSQRKQLQTQPQLQYTLSSPAALQEFLATNDLGVLTPTLTKMGVRSMNDLLGTATEEFRGDLSKWGVTRAELEKLRVAVLLKNKQLRSEAAAAALAGDFSAGQYRDASDALARARRQAVVSARLEATDTDIQKGSGAERSPPKHVGERSSCGTVQGGYWGHSAGLLWDAKLCASEFACVRPKYFPLFTEDVKAAVHAKNAAVSASTSPVAVPAMKAAANATATSETSPSVLDGKRFHADDAASPKLDPAGELAAALAKHAALDNAEHKEGDGRRSVLCYMSRGEGVRRGGMENETEMRNFVTANGRKNPFQAVNAGSSGNALSGESESRTSNRRLTPGMKAKSAAAQDKFKRGPPPSSNSTEHGCTDGVILDFTEGDLYFQDFEAQAAAVAQCDVLLGPHGAGMMHLIWMTRQSAAAKATSGMHTSSSSSSDTYQQSRHVAQETSTEPSPSPPQRATFTGAVVELLGLSHEGRVVRMYYYEHLAALAGLEYVIVSSGDPSTYEKVTNEFEDMGLGQLPDLRILAEALRPLCAAADGSGPPLQVPALGEKFGKEVAATVWHDLWR